MSKKTLTNNYLSALCKEMAMLLQSGITMKDGIQIMLEEEPSADGKLVLETIFQQLETGIPLSDAIKEGGYFPPYMINIIEIGEKTGRLTETLTSLSLHYERQERLYTSIKKATIYPATMLAMMIVVVLILIVQVLPIFNDVFGRMGAQMSPVALTLLEFGNWFRGASVAIAITAFAMFAFVFVAWAAPPIREKLLTTYKNKWGGKGLAGRIAASQFVSAMALAMSSGLDIEESIDLASSLNSKSKALNLKYEKCLSLLEAGENLPKSLRESEILSPKESRMLAIGAHSGMSDTAMEDIARRSNNNIQDEISVVVSRIEPALVIVTSVILGVILMSVMLPLIGIMTAIG